MIDESLCTSYIVRRANRSYFLANEGKDCIIDVMFPHVILMP